MVSYDYLLKKESEVAKALLKEQCKAADTIYGNTTRKTTNGLIKY